MFRSANNGFRIAAQSLPFGVAIELLFFHRLSHRESDQDPGGLRL
jgi:hypothetical protein